MGDAAERAISWPVTPVIPDTVVPGQIIKAAHDNSVVKCLSDLWTDLQAVGAVAIADPSSVKGDILVRGAAELSRLPVGAVGSILTPDPAAAVGVKWGSLADAGATPTTRRIIAGTGLGGGGDLSADVTLTANVRSVQGRTGDVTLTASDITGAGGVPATRRVIAGSGLLGGGALSGDVTLYVADDATVQRVDILKAGVVIGTRSALNWIEGANVTLTLADDAANNRVNITVAATGGGGGGAVSSVFGRSGAVVAQPGDYTASDITSGVFAPARLGTGTASASVFLRGDGVWAAPPGGGGSQTPWLQNINGGGFNLGNVGNVSALNANISQYLIAGDVSSNFTVLDSLGVTFKVGPANVARWVFQKNSTAESGGNAGSDFVIQRFNDAGASLGNAVQIVRSTGYTGLGGITPRLRLETLGTFGSPASSGTAQTGIARFSQASGPGCLDVGFGNPGVAWFQANSGDDLSVKYPIVLNPNGGNVGIGATPGTVLDVNGMIRSTQVINAPTTGMGVELSFSGSQGLISAYDRGASAWKNLAINGNIILLNATSGGNVGVGNTIPLNVFQVHGATDQNLGIAYSSGRIRLGAYNDAGSATVPMGFDASRFDFAGGNVGIGVAAPLSKLSLGGVANSSNRIAVYETTASDFRGIGMHGSSGFGVAIWANKQPLDSNADFVVKDGGNIGIATVNPICKLDFGTSVANQKLIIGLYTSGTVWGGIGMDPSGIGVRIAGDFGNNIVADFGNYSNDASHNWVSKLSVTGAGNVFVSNAIWGPPGAGLNNGALMIGAADNLTAWPTVNGTIAFGLNTTSDKLMIYVRYANGTTKQALIALG